MLYRGGTSSCPKLCHFYVALWQSFSWFFFGIAAILLFALLIGGFVVVKCLPH